MDFSTLQEQALTETKKKLREKLTEDKTLIYAYKCTQDEKALLHWLQTIVPDVQNAQEEVARKGREAWNAQGIGADMDEQGWNVLQALCKGEKPNIEQLALTVAPNTTTLLGAIEAARLIAHAGGIHALSRMTQRDCQVLGNESGQFGGPQKKSLMEEHELATNDRALRILCSRTVLAARIDANKGEFKGEKLRQEVLYAQ